MDAGNSLAGKCAHKSAQALATVQFLGLRGAHRCSSRAGVEECAFKSQLVAMGNAEFTHHSKSYSRKGSTCSPLERHGNESAIGQRLHREGSRARAWALGEIYRRPLELGHINTKHCDRTIWKFSESVLSRPMAGMVHRIHLRASILEDCGGEHRGSQVDAGTKISERFHRSSLKVDLLHVNSLANHIRLLRLGFQFVRCG